VKSVRLNNLESRVTAANYALGAVAGSAELVVPAGMTIMGSLQAEGIPEPGAMRLPVKVETIDQVVCGLGINQIDLLKVDAEGYEIDILQGASEALAHVDRVVLEYHSLDLRHGLSNCSPGVG
jgi:FkbM family methyltransferase